MDVLFDAETFAPNERAVAYKAACSAATAPHTVRFLTPAEQIRARISAVVLNADVTLLRDETSGVVHKREGRQLHSEGRDYVLLGLHEGGSGWYEHPAAVRPLHSNELFLIDTNGQYRTHRSRYGGARLLQIDRARLGVSVETVRRADNRLAGSPLYGIMRDHLVSLSSRASDITDRAALAALAEATAHLVRGLLTTAVTEQGRQVRETMQDHLLDRIRLYVRLHACDPGLGAARIATEHAISVRKLFQLWQSQPVPLAETIMQLRLDAGQRRLTAQPHLPVAAIAHACGFTSPSHFARRFREAFGCTPVQWRQRSCAHP